MCGIAGLINQYIQYFDYQTFCTLGIANDSRGGDSCGIFIDGKYEYGVDKKKLFTNFFIESDLLNETETCDIALLHCRKASIGEINESTAQPVIIKNKKGQVDFVLIHNGTIHNYQDLADKYIPKENIKDLTDSQVMAKIFYNCGYDVLDEYNGGAVFVIVDYRTNDILFFKGASKKTKNSAIIEEERPLYFSITNDTLYFSSIPSYLWTISEKVYNLTPNKLFKYDRVQFSIVKEYPRIKCYQAKEFPTVSYYYPNTWNSNSWITYNKVSNKYEDGTKAAEGSRFLSNYGKVEKKKSSFNEEVYFFDGVLLKNKECYLFLLKLLKAAKCKMTREQFCNKFKLVINFLSVDQLFIENKMCYKVIQYNQYQTFTGKRLQLCSCSLTEYFNGKEICQTYGGEYYGVFNNMKTLKNEVIDFDKLYKECMYLMK